MKYEVETVFRGYGKAPDNLKWDKRFLEMAKHVSLWSKDPNTKTGAILVRPDRTVASVGYNGFPRRVKDSRRLLMTRPAKLQRTVHCEMNAVLNYDGHVHGFTLFTWPFLSCDRCAPHMIQAGIARCVAPMPDPSSKWCKPIETAKALFEEAGVDYTEYNLGE